MYLPEAVEAISEIIRDNKRLLFLVDEKHVRFFVRQIYDQVKAHQMQTHTHTICTVHARK